MYLTKDGREVAIEQLTPDNYSVPKGEERLYHCIIEQTQFNRKNGKKLSHPRVQKFNRRIYEKVVRDKMLDTGYTITVLHDPTEWIKAHAEKVAEQKRVSAEAKEAAIQARIDEAVAKAIAALEAKKKKLAAKKQEAKSE